jgi:hypothetical protein
MVVQGVDRAGELVSIALAQGDQFVLETDQGWIESNSRVAGTRKAWDEDLDEHEHFLRCLGKRTPYHHGAARTIVDSLGRLDRGGVSLIHFARRSKHLPVLSNRMKKKDLVASLVEEGLREAAEEFFGRRVRLEEEADLLRDLVAELQKQQGRVYHFRNLLHFLLLDGDQEVIMKFYSEVSVDLTENDIIYDKSNVRIEDIIVPFSLTKEKLFTKLVYDVYKLLSIEIEAYYNGKYHKDKSIPGKKILTVNYNNLKKMIDDVNRRIEETNRCSKASDVLQFSKKMDVETQDKERITDSGVCYTLDEEMKLQSIDFDSLGLPRFTPLPRGREVEQKVHLFLGRLFKEHKQQILQLIARIQNAEQERLAKEQAKVCHGR